MLKYLLFNILFDLESPVSPFLLRIGHGVGHWLGGTLGHLSIRYLYSGSGAALSLL